ncbi:MAG: histidine triad nucleotide-binding protein [Acidobacteriota bacterium]
MAQHCLFCRIVSGEQRAEMVHEDELLVAFEDINPQAPTHILIIPRRHIPTINDISVEDEPLVGKLVSAAREIAASRGIAADGYRLVFNCNLAAGQSVFHLHAHLLGGRNLGWPPG